MLIYKTLNAAVTVALTVLVLTSSALSQAVSGTLLGSVQDSTGAIVPNVQISAVAVATGARHQVVSNGSGNYTIPDLQPGDYTVSVQATGFKKEVREHVDLITNTTTRVDLVLSTGSITETVLVTTAPALLQTDRADISTKLEARQVADLPLGTNRNFQSLLNLVPGTAPAVFQHSQFFNAQSALQTQVNGLPREGNLYQIEGIDDNERTGVLQIIIPPAEAIQSVDISTNNFEAELGRATGGVTNVTLKSGTNDYHGSVFEFIQNNAVNARSYFGGPLGHLSYNYYGGSIGGPVLKNRLFFFGDYLRTSDHERVTGTFTIPDARYYTPNSNGFIDLSGALGTANAAGIRAGQIFDPATGDGTAAHPRTLFANNQIPFSRVNPVSLSILQKVGAAAAAYGTLTPTASINNPTNNYVSALPFTKGSDSFDTKIDYTLGQQDHLSGRFSFQRVLTFQAPSFGSYLGGPAGGGFEGTGNQRAYSTGINYEHVFSQNLFTEIRGGVAHLVNRAQPNDYGNDDATTLGVPGVNLGDPFTSGQVSINLNGPFSGPLIGYSASVPWVRAEANIDVVNNWTKVLRNHTFKFGVDVRRVRDDLFQGQLFGPRGVYNFSDVQTSQAGATTSVANYVASFLFDLPSAAGRELSTYFPAYRQWWVFAYAADKWQATPKLTLDLGLRWEFYPPATPRKAGGFSNYDPTSNNLVIAGIADNPSNLGMNTIYRYFAPRTGFSYRATDSTVIRGGFGISYTPYQNALYAYDYPIRANNSYGPVGTSAFTPAVLANGVTTATFQAGFPAPVPVPIPTNGIIPATTAALISQQYYVVPLDFKNPYAESWNIAVQQALPSGMSLQLAYVANHGVRISSSQNINLPSTYGGGVASEPEYNCVGCPANLHRTAATTAQFLPFSSNYQSLQIQLTRRMSRGLAFSSAFTWGKAMGYMMGDDGGLLFFVDKRRNYAPQDYDRTLNYEQSATYELPFGRGKKYLSSGAGAVVLGGWKISAIISAVSGLPFTVVANGGTLNTPGTTQTASLAGAYRTPHGIGTTATWFDPASFSQPAGCSVTPCQIGNTGRNQFRGPGYIQDNVSLFKSFPLFREAALETRVEAFQLSNTPQFTNPNSGNIAASNFGQVTSTVGSGQGSVNGVGGGRSLQASIRISF